MYPAPVNELSFNLLGSHDTPRVLTYAEEHKPTAKLMYLFQMSYEGTPCIYYGDEIGMTSGEDPGCRKCMVWEENEQDLEMFAFLQSVISLHKTEPAFGSWESFQFVDYGEELLAYVKRSDEQTLLFFINPSQQSKKAEVSVEKVIESDHNSRG